MLSKTYRLESFGVPYQIEVARRGRTPAISDDALRAVLPPFTKRRSTRGGSSVSGRRYSFEHHARRRVLVIEDAAEVACPTIRSAQDALEGDLALHVAAGCPNRVFIHAGVVAWKGRALLLPGRTFAGKSTLVAALLAAGATYYSDEYAVLDEAGRVHPYPRRLSLRRAHGLPRRLHPRRVGKKTIPVGWVLGARYEHGASLKLTALSPGRTALLLLDNAIAARLASARVLAAVRAVAATAVGAEGIRGDVRPTVEALLPLLTSRRILQTLADLRGI